VPDHIDDSAGKGRRRPPAALNAAAAVFIAVAAFSLFAPVVPSVAVRTARGGRLVAAVPLGKGSVFSVAYVHSANKGAVRDDFLIGRDGGLVMIRSVFQSFGAGMSDGDEPGVTMRLTPEGVELDGLDRKIGIIRMAVGTVANHRLLAGGVEIPLADRAGAGTFVEIAYQRIPLAAVIRERIRNGR